MISSPTTQTTRRQSNRKFLIGLYMAAVFFYWAAMYLYVPTLPVYAKTITSDIALVGVILAQYGLWQAIVRLPLGIISDWLGRRKPFLIGGFILSALGAWVMGSATDANGLMVGRAITGFAAATWVPLVVVFSSLFPPEEAVRATSLLTVVNSVSRMLATGANGFLNDLGGYSLAFTAAVVVSGLAVLVVLPAREERLPPKTPNLKNFAVLITRPDVLTPSLLSAVLQYASWASTFGFIPILAKQLQASDVVQGLLMSMNLGVMTVGNLFATAIVKRLGARTMVYASYVLMSAGILLAAFANAIWMVVAAQVLTGLASGVGYPVLMGMSIQQVDNAERATAMGLHQAVYAIGMFAGPWLSGILADAVGIQPMFGVTAAGCLILGVAGAQFLKAKQKSGKS
ncbi:MAG TPA: MFS transporter [Anaerolineaceae bacterium]